MNVKYGAVMIEIKANFREISVVSQLLERNYRVGSYK